MKGEWREDIEVNFEFLPKEKGTPKLNKVQAEILGTRLLKKGGYENGGTIQYGGKEYTYGAYLVVRKSELSEEHGQWEEVEFSCHL